MTNKSVSNLQRHFVSCLALPCARCKMGPIVSVCFNCVRVHTHTRLNILLRTFLINALDTPKSNPNHNPSIQKEPFWFLQLKGFCVCFLEAQLNVYTRLKLSDISIFVGTFGCCEVINTRPHTIIICICFETHFCSLDMQTVHVQILILDSKIRQHKHFLHSLQTENTHTNTHASLQICFQGFSEEFDKATVNYCNVVQ